MSKRIVIALGGNALGNTAAEQLQLADQLRLLLRNAADPQLFLF